LWERDPATWDQLRNLRWHMSILNIDPAAYFGEGFKGVQELNKWAAAWAIDDLKRLLKIRDDEALQVDVDAVNEHMEPRVKSMIADFFRAKQ
jgi:hypothetical protein